MLSRLSTALSYFVSGNSLIALNGSTAAAGSGLGAASRDRILNEQTFDTQVQVATDENGTMSRQLAASEVDTSYLRWNNAWGQTTAKAPYTTGVNDQLRLEGLQYQWYSNIEGKILTTALKGEPR